MTTLTAVAYFMQRSAAWGDYNYHHNYYYYSEL